MFAELFRLNRQEKAAINAAATKALAPPLPGKPPVSRRAELEEYATVARAVGVETPAFHLENFTAFMAEHDLPLYNLHEVVRYMDAKVKAEGKPAGWCWRPVRPKDSLLTGNFGRRAESTEVWTGTTTRIQTMPASDFYPGSGTTAVYNRTMPLHALQRIRLIEASYLHGPNEARPFFLVSDYEAMPAFRPDPFLMVVIKNPRLAEGEGRFVIDFWDEPGFGLESMLK